MDGLRAMYAVHLRLIGKPVVPTVDFLLVIIELFSLGVTAEKLSQYRLEVAIFEGGGSLWP